MSTMNHSSAAVTAVGATEQQQMNIHTNYSSFDDVDVDVNTASKNHRLRRNQPVTTTTQTNIIADDDNDDVGYIPMNQDPLETNHNNINERLQQQRRRGDPTMNDNDNDGIYHDNNNNNNNGNNNHNNNNNDDIKYRGFSTSIRDMYLYTNHERTDCCSITCCGMLQSDRDRYLLSGIKPPGPIRRCTYHILLPLTIFITAGVAAMRIKSIELNQLVCLTLILLLILYFFIQCQKGRSKRMNIRKDLLYTKYQIRKQLLLQQQQQQQIEEDRTTEQTDGQRKRRHQHPMLRGDNDDVEEPPPSDDDDIIHGGSSNLCCCCCCPDHQHQTQSSVKKYLMGQTSRDIHNAHPCCLLGCYPDDRINNNKKRNRRRRNQNGINDIDNINDNNIDDPYQHNRITNICSDMLNVLFNPICCGGVIQCCGVCAIAQEAREIEHIILPSSYRRIDYITMEPFIYYYPLLYQYKMGNNNTNTTSSVTPAAATSDVIGTNESNQPPSSQRQAKNKTIHHYNVFGIPLSRLSYRLLQTLFIFLSLLLIWVIIAPYYWYYIIGRKNSNNIHLFTIWDFMILIATFGHSILLMSIIVYITNYVVHIKDRNGQQQQSIHSQFSLDAIIKFFATGFFLSASLAFFWEVIAVLFVDIVVSISLALSGINLMTNPNMNNNNNNNASYGDNSSNDDHYIRSSTKSIIKSLLRQSPSSYHLTAITGNGLTTKPFLTSSSSYYYMKDDMDGETPNGTPDYVDIFGYDHPVLYTLYLATGAFFVASLIEELCKYYGYRMAEEHPDFLTENELIKASKVIHAQQRQQQQNNNSMVQSNDDDDDDDEDDNSHDIIAAVTTAATTNTNQDNIPSASNIIDFSNQLKSLQAHGAAITLAMVAVAIGFSCCENLIYIFIYAGKSISLELGVLIERAFFPLHPIVAAIQSVGVCYRDVEKSRKYQNIGRIILPAVIVHGCFDFFILWIDFLGKLFSSNDNASTNDDIDIANKAELWSVISCIVIMLSGILYFYYIANLQRERLAQLDRRDDIIIDQSSLI